MGVKIDQQQVLGLVDLLYEAAVAPSTWPRFLQELTATVGAETATLALHDVKHHAGQTLWQFGVDPEYARLYEHYAHQNVYMIAAAPHLKTGFIHRGEDAVSDHEVMRTEFFNDYMKRIGTLHNVGCCILQERSLSAMLVVNRRIGRTSFSAAEMALLRTLLPHLQRATLVQQRLEGAELQSRTALDALDRLPIGIFLLNQSGSVVFQNATASAILSDGDGLKLHREGLAAAIPAETAALRRLVGRVSGERSLRCTEIVLQISRPSGRRGFLVVAAPAPIAVRGAMPSDVPRTILFVSDPEHGVDTPSELLTHLYGLTPTEAHIAVLLAQGLRSDTIAETIGITLSTARTHVKRILSKTDTGTQSALVRIILQGVGRFGFPHSSE